MIGRMMPSTPERLDLDPEDCVCLWDCEREAWWRDGGNGYTHDVNKAGRFRRGDERVQRATSLRSRGVYAIPVEAAYGIVCAEGERILASLQMRSGNLRAQCEGVGS